MWQDPIVEEVRAIRDAYSKRFEYDLDAICDDIKERELKSGRAFVTLPPRHTSPSEHKDPSKTEGPGLPTGSN